MATLIVNGIEHRLDIEDDTPLLWAVRDELNLKGTKFGCGMAQCGACTVHLDGTPIRSCVTPVSAVEGRAITTIEGVSNGRVSSHDPAASVPGATASYHIVQQAWIDEQVPQCGYCQSGQVMAAVALLERSPLPSDQEIDQAMSGNVCRCGMYGRIKKAIKRASAKLPTESADAEEVTNG